MKQNINIPETWNFKGLYSMKGICKSYQNLNAQEPRLVIGDNNDQSKWYNNEYLKVCTLEDRVHGTQVK